MDTQLVYDMISDKETIAVLNDLIRTCNDGVRGFRTAAESINDIRAREVFATRATEIEQARQELVDEVVNLGGDPQHGGTAVGAVHRGWLDLKAAVTGGDDDGVLTECARGEDHAIRMYDSALRTDLPESTREVIERQRSGAVTNLDAVRRMKQVA